MGLLFSWWLVIEVVGLVGMPLTATIFANLPDRGWSLGKPLSLLLIGWLIWFPLSIITALPYNGLWIFLTFLVFAGFNVVLFTRSSLRSDLRQLVTGRPLYIAASELVFTVGFLLMAWIRSFNPAVATTEKFMDVAFLSSLWRTQHLPPPDPWLSGAPINYYYFGHFLLATIAKLLGTQPGTAFNVGIALIFGLVAVAVFGVSTNLTAIIRTRSERNLYRALPFGLFSALAVLVFGNLNSVQVWWQQALQLAKDNPKLYSTPWSWWLHRDLWVNYHWWDPSRVISNTINEFPAFSFVLSDLHAHVLALPFAALAVGLALNLLLARGLGIRLFGAGSAGLYSLLGTAIAIGSLYFINGWDLPTYLGLALLALAIQQWLAHGRRFNSTFLIDLFTPAALLLGLALLLYMPFYRSFVSPSQGIGLVAPTDRSPIGYEVAIFGLPLFLVLSLLFFWGVRALAPLAQEDGFGLLSMLSPGDAGASLKAHSRLLVGGVLGVVVALLALWTARTQQNQGWTLFWSLLVVLCCAALTLRYLLPARTPADATDAEDATDENNDITLMLDKRTTERQRAELFVLILVGTAAALVGACEVVFLRDIFQDRMNTVFKLYYQAWVLLGICGGPALALLLGAARRSIVAAVATFSEASSNVNAAPKVALAGSGGLAAIRTRLSALTTARSRLPLAFAATRHDAATSTTPAASGTSGAAEGNGADTPEVSAIPGRTPRINWPPAAPASFPSLLRMLGAAGMLVWIGVLVVLVGAALIYPVLATSAFTDNFALPPHTAATLDGTAYMSGQSPDTCTPCANCQPIQPYSGTNLHDDEAIAWLNTHVQGSQVILEAPGCEWSYYSRISAFTGMPTLLGWPGGHEGEWRINWLPQQGQGDILGQRAQIINDIYTNPNVGTVMSLLHQYHVSYVYVGYLERDLYANSNLDRFKAFLHLIYNRDGVSIYAVP